MTILTVWLAIISIYCIDFCINAGEYRGSRETNCNLTSHLHLRLVQALDRALLVDTLPTAKQPAGNAWAARMLAIGSVTGFFVGNLDLPHFFPFFGSAQLKVLSVIAALLLFLTQAWVCFHVKERVLLRSSSGPKGLRQELGGLWETLAELPSVIRQIVRSRFLVSKLALTCICSVGFNSLHRWGGSRCCLQPQLYIGDLHKSSSPIPENDAAAIALDCFGVPGSQHHHALLRCPTTCGARFQPSSTKAEDVARTCSDAFGKFMGIVPLCFAMCMAATFVTSTVSGATFIMSVTGFCWAITQWAPYALLGEAILSHPASDDAGSIHLTDTRSTRVVRSRDDVEHNADEEETLQLFKADVDDEEGEYVPKRLPHLHAYSRADIQSPSASRASSFDQDDELDPHPRIIGLGNSRARVSRLDIAIPSSPPSVAPLEGNAVTSTSGSTRKSANGLSAQAGAIIGIHNMFIVIPQFLVTGLSSIIFAIFDPDKSVLHGHHPGNTQPGNGTITPASQDAARQLFSRSDDLSQTRPNSIAIIFRHVLFIFFSLLCPLYCHPDPPSRSDWEALRPQ
ncbi:hypothetical protein J3R83DRAFT_8938 [Lanmaoa asiatica]|nr:hypothetical protein J3R83DRAFT_8938 [Lanmaoa asiatica]